MEIELTRAKEIISPGAIVEILSRSEGDVPQKKQQGILKDPIILYEDEEIIVVEKPPGLLLSLQLLKESQILMFDRVLHWTKRTQKKRAYLIHRLDRETLGLFYSR